MWASPALDRRTRVAVSGSDDDRDRRRGMCPGLGRALHAVHMAIWPGDDPRRPAIIPDLEVSGQLPPGRYRATVDEVEARFVRDARWDVSETRPKVWNGFRSYVDAWRQVEADTGVDLLKGVWMGGSFVSSEMNPADLDASPIYDDIAFRSLKGRPGAGHAARLIGHRQSVVEAFAVEPFAIGWRSIPSTLFVMGLDNATKDSLAVRGGLDDWWQRVRPEGARRAPEAPVDLGVRGYIEVVNP